MPPAADYETEILDRANGRIGSVLRQKWRLDRLLGIGGMAAVYAATHRNGKRAAVKVLHPELSVVPDVRSRFLREGYLANKLESPGAVSVLDDDVSEDGAVFLVMELLEGEPLDETWERAGRRLEPSHVLRIADSLLDVLASAHALGIVHRDIKPENLFVLRDGSLKVLDFGIARLRELSGQVSPTRSGMPMGTPVYMPPEQARGRWDEVDHRSDLWAVGATMFTLLTGRFVHEAGTINEQLLAAMTVRATPIGACAPDVPPVLGAIVDRALAFNPADRWPDARAMQAALRAAMVVIPGPAALSAAGVEAPHDQPSASERLAVARTQPLRKTARRPAPTLGMVIGGGVLLGLLTAGVGVAVVMRGRAASVVEPSAPGEPSAPAPLADPSRTTPSLTAPAELAAIPASALPAAADSVPRNPGALPPPGSRKSPAPDGSAAPTASTMAPPGAPPAATDDLLDRRK